MESHRIVQWRQEYLEKIGKYRGEGRPIIYLDETWYDTHDIKRKGWSDGTIKSAANTPSSRGKRIILIHAGSESGFVKGALKISAKNINNSSADYHQDMNSELFEAWFKDNLLCNIPQNSVIVLDNAPYHSRQVRKIPNTSCKKDDIISFLNDAGVQITNKATKSDLLKIVKDLNPPKLYYVDELAKSNGHIVLRLPPYYCEFNPIEMIWSQIKQFVRRNNHNPRLSSTVVGLIRRSEEVVEKHWRNCVRHVLGIENKYKMNNINPVIINLNDSSDSSLDDSD